jgi:hypothetical protein
MPTATAQIPSDILQLGAAAVDFYVDCLDRGQSESMAEILTMQQAPGLRTEASEIAARNQSRGGNTLADQFSGAENLLEYRVAQAKRQGYTPNATDYYDSSVARFPGDKRAWLSGKQSAGDVRRDIASHGGGMMKGGDVTLSPNTDVAPTPPKKLNERIVSRIEQKMVADDPSLKEMDRMELRESIKDKHGSNDKEAVS